MISAGQYAGQTQYPQYQQGYGQYPQGYGQYPQGYGQSPYGSMPPQMGQAPQMPQWNGQMQQMPSTGGMNIALSNENVSDETINKIAEAQNTNTKNAITWTAVGNLMNSLGAMTSTIAQACLNAKYLENQGLMIEKHYELQGKIVSGQTTVALKQYDVQEKAISAQVSMHKEQASHEEKMAKIAGNVQVKLAAMDQAGRTERAKIISVTDPFSSRGRYDAGMPAFLC